MNQNSLQKEKRNLVSIKDDFESGDFSAFKNGGGNAAMNQKGQTPGEVMQQGREKAW